MYEFPQLGEYIFFTPLVYTTLAGGTWEANGRKAGGQQHQSGQARLTTDQVHTHPRMTMHDCTERKPSHRPRVAGPALYRLSGTLLFSWFTLLLLPFVP